MCAGAYEYVFVYASMQQVGKELGAPNTIIVVVDSCGFGEATDDCGQNKRVAMRLLFAAAKSVVVFIE